MGFLANIKEKVINSKSNNGSKIYDEEIQNLDTMIEDLFKMDEQVKREKKEEVEK
jgi:hypothetical protein